MKKILVLFLLLFLAVTVFADKMPWEKTHPLLDITVLVGNKDVGGMGAGFIITDDGYLITAAHVVTLYGTTLAVFPEPPHFLIARIVYVDTLNDWAVLKVERARPFPAIEVGSLADVQLGDPLIYCGHPAGLTWLIARGILSGVKFDENGRQYIFSDLATAGGASGSAICDQNNRVVGIVQMGLPGLGCIGISTDDIYPIVVSVIIQDRQLIERQKWLRDQAERIKLEWRILEKRLAE